MKTLSSAICFAACPAAFGQAGAAVKDGGREGAGAANGPAENLEAAGSKQSAKAVHKVGGRCRQGQGEVHARAAKAAPNASIN